MIGGNFSGATSRRHDHQGKYPVQLVEVGNPILKGVSTNWVTAMDELYIIENFGPMPRRWRLR